LVKETTSFEETRKKLHDQQEFAIPPGTRVKIKYNQYRTASAFPTEYGHRN
jgi:hypothetical protein